MANKKVQAIELFKQGKQPGDPEVTALGLKPRTLRDYFNDWKTAQSIPEAGPKPSGEKVELSSLGTLELFTYKGRTYSKRRVLPDGIKALSSKGDKLIALPPDTLVTKVEVTETAAKVEVYPEATPETKEAVAVPIQDLKPGQKFELDGDLFILQSMEPESATAGKLEWAPGGDCMIERWQRPVPLDALVIPKD